LPLNFGYATTFGEKIKCRSENKKQAVRLPVSSGRFDRSATRDVLAMEAAFSSFTSHLSYPIFTGPNDRTWPIV